MALRSCGSFHDDHQGGLDEVLGRGFVLAYDRGDLRRTNTGSAVTNYLTAAGARRRTVHTGNGLPARWWGDSALHR